MRDKMIETLERELQILNNSWQLAMDHAADLIKTYEGRQVSTHLGHNLANRATELSEIAAKVDEVQSILAFVREQQEAEQSPQDVATAIKESFDRIRATRREKTREELEQQAEER